MKDGGWGGWDDHTGYTCSRCFSMQLNIMNIKIYVINWWKSTVHHIHWHIHKWQQNTYTTVHPAPFPFSLRNTNAAINNLGSRVEQTISSLGNNQQISLEYIRSVWKSILAIIGKSETPLFNDCVYISHVSSVSSLKCDLYRWSIGTSPEQNFW